MSINSRDEDAAARKRLGERMQHTAEVCAASRRGDPVTPERLAEIRANDARTCGDDSLYFNGYSMVHVDRHDLLRHLDAVGVPAPSALPHDACVVCRCTPAEPCEDADDGDPRIETSLETVLCATCAETIARDAVAAGVYPPVPAGALF